MGNKYKIIAHRKNRSFLLVVGDNDKNGIIISVEDNKIFDPKNIDSILARGYWEEYDGKFKDKRFELKEWAKIFKIYL